MSENANNEVVTFIVRGKRVPVSAAGADLIDERLVPPVHGESMSGAARELRNLIRAVLRREVAVGTPHPLGELVSAIDALDADGQLTPELEELRKAARST